MPAVACGTMRTDLTTAATTRTTRATSRMVTIRVVMAASLPRPVRGSRGLRGCRACWLRYRPQAGSGGPPRLAVLDLQLDAEAAGQVTRGEDLLDRPGREHRAPAQQHGVGEAVGHLFD